MNNQELTPTGVLCPVCGRTFRNTQGLGSHRVFAHERPTAQARGSPSSRQAPRERHVPPTGPATPTVQVWPSSSETGALGHLCGVVLLFSPATQHTYLQLQQQPLFYSTPTSLTASTPFPATMTAGQGSLVRTSCPSVMLPTFCSLLTPDCWWQGSPTTDDASRTDNPEPLLEWEEQDLIDLLTVEIDG